METRSHRNQWVGLEIDPWPNECKATPGHVNPYGDGSVTPELLRTTIASPLSTRPLQFTSPRAEAVFVGTAPERLRTTTASPLSVRPLALASPIRTSIRAVTGF